MGVIFQFQIMSILANQKFKTFPPAVLTCTVKTVGDTSDYLYNPRPTAGRDVSGMHGKTFIAIGIYVIGGTFYSREGTHILHVYILLHV